MSKRTLPLIFAVFFATAPAVDVKYIIFKLDDVQAHWPYVVSSWTNVANTFISNGLHASFGLIGDDTELYGETYPEWWAWYQHCESNGIQFWNHTFNHTDLTAMSAKGQWWQLARSQNMVRRKTGSNLSGYGAPNNLINGDSMSVVRDMDNNDYWFFGNTNSNKKVLLRFGDMEYPTLVPQYAAFISNWPKTLSNASNANADYLVFQGHPGSWDTNRFTNFLNVLSFLTNQGYQFVTPLEYMHLKTQGLSILTPLAETSVIPGQAVAGTLTGSNVSWSVDLWDGNTSQNLASGTGTNYSFAVPASVNISNRVRVNANSVDFTRSRTFTIAPLSTNDLIQSASLSAGSASPGYEPALALDRSLGSGWSPSGALPQNLTADFGSLKQVGSAHLVWKAGHHADEWSLLGSQDGSSWFVLATNDIGWGGAEYVPFSATNLRYLRLSVGRSIRADGRVELSEFFAFSTGAATHLETNLIAPEADAQVHSSYPNSNFGGKTTMEVLSPNGRHAYIRFALGSNTRPVTRATLYLYPNQGYQIDALHTLKLVTNNNWDELAVTWSNRPALNQTLGVQAPFYYRSAFDVTSVVTQAMAGDNKITFAICGTNGTYMNYISREETNYGGLRAPALELGYEPIAPATSNMSLSVQITNPTGPLNPGAYPATQAIQAAVFATNLAVTQVVFSVGGLVVGADTNAQDGFSALWGISSNGSYTLSAVAYGSGGLAATNQLVVNVALTALTNLVVAITNPAGALHPVSFPYSVTAGAAVWATNCTATQMAFSVDGNAIGQDTNGADGFGVIWNIFSNGTYTLRALATGTGGTAATNTLSISVSQTAQLPSGHLTNAAAILNPVKRQVALAFSMVSSGFTAPTPTLSFRYRVMGQANWVIIPGGEITAPAAATWAGAQTNIWAPGSGVDLSKQVEVEIAASAEGIALAPAVAGNIDLNRFFRLAENLDKATAVGSPFRGDSEGITFVNLTPDTTLTLMSTSGQVIKTLPAPGAPARALWDVTDRQGRPVPPGVYICLLKSGGESRMIRVLVTQ